MELLTTYEAKLIFLGMNINTRTRKMEQEGLNDIMKGIFEKEKIKAENAYFDLRFEHNQEGLQDKFIVAMVEQGHEQEEVEEMLRNGTGKFAEYCYELCLQNL